MSLSSEKPRRGMRGSGVRSADLAAEAAPATLSGSS